MFKTILADLDPRAENQPVLPRLRRVARAEGSRVHLLACDYMDSLGSAALATGGDTAMLQQARKDYVARIETWLDEQAEALSDDDFDVSASVRWHSPRYEAILDHAREVDADLVMRAARHHSKLERLLLGATDWELVRRSPVPVWFVKRHADSDEPLNVVAAVDPLHESEKKLGLDERIIDTAAHIARTCGGELHLFHAWQPGTAIAPAIAAGPHVPMPVMRIDADAIESIREQRADMLAKLASRAGTDDAHTHLEEGAVTACLDDVVEQHDIDVVVAGGVARGRLERLIIGSTAEAILDHVDRDIVVVKPDASQRKSGGNS